MSIIYLSVYEMLSEWDKKSEEGKATSAVGRRNTMGDMYFGVMVLKGG